MTERLEIHSGPVRGADRSFPGTFEQHARCDGEAVALLVGEKRVRRSQLESHANRLAHFLHESGVVPECRVGILLERNEHLVAALLAVLKAGAAYVPLDPALPHQRLAGMLRDAGVSHLLTESHRPDLPGAPPVRRLHVDEADLNRHAGSPPIPLHHSESLAYVIYTSGSTGRPKGVEIRRAALDNFLDSMARRPGLTSRDTVVAMTTVGFDIAVLELLLPLHVGARIVLVDRHVAGDPVHLANVLTASRATVLQATPATWRLLVGSGWPGLPGLRALCGGEALHGDLAADLLDRTAELWNVYGPTETTVWSSLSRVERGAAVRLGEPIESTRIHLLGRDLQPAETGEIWIGGVGLARGYHSRPALTAERFNPDPFGPPGSRLYRTGDLGRRDACGAMEFLGRADEQLKVRGFRIEPAEVEYALRRDPEVDEAVVVAHGRDSGDVRLVAYLVGPRLSPARFEELRAGLAEILPGYMVPAVFAVLRKLPTTASGKVDRNALSRRALPERGGEALPPQTEVEQAVLATWSEVLGRAGLGVEDDFFALGGHSLLASKVVSRLRDRFGVELRPRSLFDHPTPRRLASAVRKATPTKDAPLEPRIHDGRPLPLSFAQRRLWFLDQLAPGTSAYNLADRLHLVGELNTAALGAALDALVARHETLRTTFPATDGRPEQRIADENAFPRLLVDLTPLPRGARRDIALRFVSREAGRPFDLARGPLARALVVRLRPDEHFLLLALHHIIADGWSLGVLYRELDRLYQAGRAGLASALPRPRLQYADFTLWQHAVFDAVRLASEIAYWRERLAGAPEVLQLPADRPRDRAHRSRQGRRTRILDAGLRRGLDRLGRGAGTSLFMTLLALWMTLVHRFSGLRDVLVGSPVSGRYRAETEGLIGFFVNTLVLRGDLRGEPSFTELLRRVRETALEAMCHQELPFERLVEELRPERHLDRNPFFQVMFDLQNVPEHLGLGPLEVRRSELLPGGSEFEPSLSIREQGTKLVAFIEYDASLFDATTIERLLLHFETLTRGAAARPERKLSEMDFFSDAGSHQILTEWNDTERHFEKRPATFLTHFQDQVRRRPEALALIDVASGRSLTYRELDEMASRAGGELRRRGVGPESRVGVLMSRSVELVAALLGIFRAGGAYVSLDPSYPEERLDLMVEDSETLFLLQDADPRLFSTPSGEEVRTALHPEGAAYVIYTSGSTGEPKGVVVSHRALAWYCLASGRHYGLGPGERVLQFASVSFDISVGEIFPTLAAGATLVLRDDEMAGSIDAHQKRCREHQVSVLLPPTAFWHELAAALERRGDDFLAPSLRLVSFGGEQVIGERIAAWRRRVGERVELWNGYGPTEATVEAAILPLRGAVHENAARIGRPIDGVSILVLDPALRPTAVGAPGELAITSPGLARGYHRRPAATARRFVPHPHTRRPGERLYLSGDLARHLADGTLELLGRTDRQVKVRGFRLELGEVEAQLLRHPAVDEAVAEIRGGRLVAYLVSTVPPDVQALRAWLRRRLPAYMVPAAFVALGSLPLSAGGKIDRGSLPDPEPAATASSYVAPGSGIETQIATVWRNLLSREKIGVDDDFFHLGGHSLLAAQVASRLRGILGIEVPVRLLFERTTLAELAAEILRRLDDGQVTRWSQPPLVPAPRERGPLSFAQQRLYFLDRLEEKSAAYLMPDAFRLTGPLDVAALLRALGELKRRHQVLAARYREEDGVVSQTPTPTERTRTLVVDLSRLGAPRRETVVRALVEDEGTRPFDLAGGPAIRTVLLFLGKARHVLLRTIHHIASDGWSDALFYRELGALYRASPLPELPLQYADFAIWQRSWLVGEVLDRQLVYWREALAGAPATLHFPADRPRARSHRRGATQRRRLDQDLRIGLEELSRRNKATLFMTLLAAWTLLLERYTGRDDLVVGSPIANRSRPELEDLIGCFVNSLALRARVEEGESFREHLRQVRETVLGALAHQDLPFEKLVDELGAERHLGTNPLFQVMFDHQLVEKSALELEGVQAEPIVATSLAVTFEPSLTVWNDGDELVAGIEHDADLFEEVTVSRMLAHYEDLLRGALDNPERQTDDLAFGTEAEQRQVLARRERPVAREAPPETATKADEAAAAALAKIWAEVLGLPQVSDDENFFALGGDSILSLRVLARARLAGIHLRPRDLFRHQTVAALARHLAANRGHGDGRVSVLECGEVPLTPMQRSFFTWQLPEPWHYNQSVFLVLRRRIEVGRLAAAARRLGEHHPSLRLRFERSGSTWRQILRAEPGAPPVARLDLGGLAPDRRFGALEKAKTEVQASLDLSRGPTWRLVLFDDGLDAPQRLLAVVHHLAVDAVSWGVLLDDLERFCAGRETPTPVALPATVSFPEWARRLAGEEVDPDERALFAHLAREAPLPTDLEGANTIDSEATVTTRLGTPETGRLLRGANAAYRTRPEELLLTVLGRALARWSGGHPLVELELHGREALGEEVDLSRSVGWFTVTWPVALRVRGAGFAADLLTVKETLRQVPRQGLAYGLLRERDGEARLRRLQPQVSFNYLAHVEKVRLDGSSLFAAHESPGREQSRRGTRTHLLELNGWVAEGRFEMEWAYSTNVFERSTVEALAASFEDELCRLLEHCLSPGAGGVSPSDFPLARIDPATLERLLQPFAHPFELEDVYPLTPLQEGMLFHSRLAPLSGVYFEQVSWILDDVDRDALRRAWQTVVDRHPVLRTSFVWEGLERPLQRVHRRIVVPFEEHDFRLLGDAEKEAGVERLLEDDRRRGFAFQEAPLLRLLLVRISDSERGEVCRLVWSCHHLLLDGWSTPTVLGEAAAAYESLRRGKKPRLPSPRPFRDYLAWLAERPSEESAESFWHRLLAGFEAPTPLPPPPAGGSRLGEDAAPGEASLALEPGLTGTLGAAARRRALTLNTVVRGAWARVLMAVAGEDDVVFGATVSGRPAELAGAEPIVGLLANTLPVRARRAGRETVGRFLGRLQEEQAEMQRFETTPLVEIQRWSDVAAGESLFHTVLVFENFPLTGNYRDTDLPGLRTFSKTSYPMTLYAEPGPRLILELSYDRLRVGAAFAKRSLRYLATALAALAEGFKRDVSELDVLSAAERHQLSIEWAAELDAATERSALELFETQARSRPEAVALVFRTARGDTEAFTYGELDRRAGELAERLRGAGVGPEGLVGVQLERSLRMVVALLAVWKAGGAYVPLDPAYPEERLRLMAADAGLVARIPEVENGAGNLSGPSSPRRSRSSEETPGHLAYVLYTSGSTGQPKGVEVTHRTLARFLAAMARRPGFTPEDSLLAVTTVSFDIAALELWLPLTRGARVVLADRETARDGRRLRRTLAEARATVLQGTPATWRLLLAAGWQDGDGLMALCGGEAMPRDLAAELGRRCREAWNLYGPTEATVWSLVHRLRAFPDAIAIGRPIDATRVHVLDRRMRPAPIGSPGEIHLGGGLARGYRRRGAATAAAFVPDPFAGPGSRLYKTGDLARFQDDATLLFLGRRDQQVKIRGFRIEPGEVEAALLCIKGVREAAVVVQDTEADRRLVAFVVADGAPGPSRLRALLQEKLPPHLIPTAFAALAALPRSPAGKVDRRALADLSLPLALPKSTARSTPTEEILAGIWSQVLGGVDVGPEESFFDLGGHSLHALRVASRIRTDLGRELELRLLFENPTVRSLARHLERDLPLAAAPPIRPTPRDGPLPLSFAQERMWLLERLSRSRESGTYQVHGALEIRGELDVAALQTALRRLVERHETQRARFPSRRGEPQQVIRPVPEDVLAVSDLSALPPERLDAAVRSLSRRESYRPFDLAGGPPVRTVLLRLGKRRHVLLRTVHHIASDGYSERIVRHELAELYQAARDGRPDPLPRLPIGYVDFARWQRRHLTDAVLDAELTWWRERLQGLPPVLRFPNDRPRRPEHRPRPALLARPWPATLRQELEQLRLRLGTTFFMTCLAAFAALVGRYTGSTDIVLGTPIANRNRRETEGLVGAFVNTVLVRIGLGGSPTVRELLVRVREAALDVHSHQELPFERLVQGLAPHRRPGENPLFEVMFLANGEDGVVELSGLDVESLDEDEGTALFELTLSVSRSPESVRSVADYDGGLFDETTLHRILRGYESLLRGFTEAPDSRLAELGLMDAAERHQILREWNDTAAAWGDTPPTVPRLWAQQAARTPAADAVVFEGGRWTYGELQDRTLRLAHFLRGRGVDLETRVGLLGERSPEMVTALLATLTAGGTAVPLDPAHPPWRLARTLQDACVSLLLTQERQRGLLEELPAPAAVFLDAGREEAEPKTAETPLADPHPEAAAYLIYTSGSTGRPKGAVNTHRGLSNHLLWMRRDYPLTVNDRVALKTPPSFDVALWETLWPLVSGAALVLARPAGHLDSAYLARWIARQEITVLHHVPSALPLWLGEGVRPKSLRWVICGGEALPSPYAERFAEQFENDATLHNFYGPAEASVGVTARACEPRPRTLVVALGRPGAETDLHLADRALYPLPLGTAGEVLIGGAPPGRGYWKDPRRSADRFVPDPWSGRRGARLYRTGDLARRAADGTLHFLGRTDHQVSLRGQRIEPGEVEAVLGGHPEVLQAAVVVRRLVSGEEGMVAFVVARETSGSRTWRRFLAERLPAAMVPAVFVPVDTLPRTPAGKVDRAGLQRRSLRPRRRTALPSGETERRLAALYAEVLGLPKVDADGEFFSLGGHSLLAVRLLARIEETFGVAPALSELFHEPTVRRLAARLDGRPKAAPSLLVELAAGGSAPFFCVHPVGGQVLGYRELVARLPPGLPVYALQSAGHEDGRPFLEDVESMARAYLEAVRKACAAGPYLFGGWSMGGWIAFEMARQLRRDGGEAALVVLIDSSAPGGNGHATPPLLAFAEELGLPDGFCDPAWETLPPELGLRRLRERAGEVLGNGTDPRLLEHLYRLFRNNMRAIERYVPGFYDGRITLLVSESWTEEELAPWRELAVDVEVSRVPGDHRSMMCEPHVRVLADRLAERLRKHRRWPG